jgi:hypothetical protein
VVGYDRNAFLSKEFATMEDIKSNAMAKVQKIPKEVFRLVFKHWQD